MNLKKIMGIIMVVLLIVSLVSLFSLSSKADDKEFLARVNNKELRAQHVGWIEKHYVPVQVFSIGFVIFTIYTLLRFINSDYIDGKTYKIIIFFIINTVAIVRAVFINQRIFHAGKLAPNGEFPPTSYLLVPMLTVTVLYLLGQLVEKSIENDYFKEAKLNEGTEYSDNWKKLENALKK